MNIYDIYRFCYIPPTRSFSAYIDGKEVDYSAGMTGLEYTPWRFTRQPSSKIYEALEDNSDEDTPPCVYSAGVSHFLNNQTVRDALHIPAGVQAW